MKNRQFIVLLVVLILNMLINFVFLLNIQKSSDDIKSNTDNVLYRSQHIWESTKQTVEKLSILNLK